MKFISFFFAFFSAGFAAETAVVLHPNALKPIEVSSGVVLKELTGRSPAAPARSEKCSVAFFHLEPGKASAWSYNKTGEESFFVLKGQGEIRTGNKSQPMVAGSFILVPPGVVRSIRASASEALEFYAVTAPAWSQDDDVLTDPPAGAK